MHPHTQQLFWQPDTASGFEHTRLARSEQGTAIDSLVIVSLQAEVLHLRYQAFYDAKLQLRSLRLQGLNHMLELSLSGDGHGFWRDRQGQRLGLLDGCLDVLFDFSPNGHQLLLWRQQQHPSTSPFNTLNVNALGHLKACKTELQQVSEHSWQLQRDDQQQQLSVDQAQQLLTLQPGWQRVLPSETSPLFSPS